MLLRKALLVLASIIFSSKADEFNKQCDYTIRVPSQQVITVSNPGWPAVYGADETCRWIFVCPSGFACRIRCREVRLPKTDNCFLDKLLISAVGSVTLRGAHVYCGGQKINVRSIGSKIVLALVTDTQSPGGRFRCKVRPEPSVV